MSRSVKTDYDKLRNPSVRISVTFLEGEEVISNRYGIAIPLEDHEGYVEQLASRAGKLVERTITHHFSGVN